MVMMTMEKAFKGCLCVYDYKKKPRVYESLESPFYEKGLRILFIKVCKVFMNTPDTAQDMDGCISI